MHTQHTFVGGGVHWNLYATQPFDIIIALQIALFFRLGGVTPPQPQNVTKGDSQNTVVHILVRVPQARN